MSKHQEQFHSFFFRVLFRASVNFFLALVIAVVAIIGGATDARAQDAKERARKIQEARQAAARKASQRQSTKQGQMLPTSASYNELIKKIDPMINEQKFQAALDIANAEYLKITEPVDQARILTKIVQLESGLHDYETAVNNFVAKKWPADYRAQSLLNIYYAYSLQQYVRAYSWEINQRTKIASKAKKDLKSWTVEEIYGDAILSMASVWPQREKMAELSKGAWSDYIAPNSYPDGVRDTFRETYSMLFVRILNDSSGWTPEQSNEIFRLNLQTLMNGRATPGVDLKSVKVHPLEKMAAVLYDLKSWHESKQNLNAALDVHLEMLKILYARFTHEKDREAIRAKLTDLLQIYERTPWYSMGAGTLAQFWMQEDDPDALVKAKRFASVGAEKFPDSLGAGLCRDLIKQIEAPSFSLQAMRVDTQKRRSMGLSYKNLRKMYFSAFRFDLKKFVQESQDYNHYPSWKELQEIQKSKPVYTWSVDLPATTDYREHTMYVTPPDHEPGFYVVAASTLPTLQEDGNQIQGAMMFFSDLVISQKIENGIARFEVRNGTTGKFLKDVNLHVYRYDYGKRNVLENTLRTDANGRAEFRSEDKTGRYSQYGVFGELGKHSIFTEFNLYNYGGEASLSPRAIVYTDRSIYRPQQKIMWKVLFYQPTKEVGKFELLPKATQVVNLMDMNGQVVETKQITTDEFGAAWGEFTIPTGRSLGRWMVRTAFGAQSVSIEEYKRPTFELSWKEQKTPIRLNQKAEIVGEAKYYFGAPLTSGRVRYSVERSAVFPWWCFWGYFNWGGLQRPQVVATSETKVDADGTFKIQFIPEADSRVSKSLDDVKYNYTISAEVLDDGGETRTTKKSVAVGFKSVEAFLSLPSQMVLEDKPVEVGLRRVLLTGDPAPGSGKWKLVRLQEPKAAVMPAEQKTPSYLKSIAPKGLQIADDGKQSRWSPSYNWPAIVRDWAEGEAIKKSEIETDSKGAASIKLPALRAGTYRLIYETKDSYGAAVDVQAEFFVASGTYRPQLPGLFLMTQSQAKVGEDVYLWLPTALKDQTFVFEAFQDGKVIDKRVLNSNKDSGLIKWPVKESMRGGLGFTVRLLNDYQELDQAQSLFVPWDNKEINVEFTSFRDKLRPGQNETWTVKLTGPKKEKLAQASVQLLAYMYDRSLDQLMPHTSYNLLSIYPSRASYNFYSVNLGQAPGAGFRSNYNRYSSEYSPPTEDYATFYNSYGIGGPGRRGGRGGGKYMTMKSVSRMEESDSMVSMAPAAAPAEGMADQKAEKKQNEVGKLAQSKEDSGVGGAKDKAANEPKRSDSRGQAGSTLRSNFSETAFFSPNLKNNSKGEVEIKFKVPDSVTSWTLWLQGLTQDLKVATANKQSETVKELMIRPYLPRFLREGDRASLRFVLNNTSDKPMTGKINVDLFDEDGKTDASARFRVKKELLKAVPFTIAANKSFTHEISLETPAGLGSLVIKAMATAGNLADGELRSLPILPGRFHLAQSKFVTLKDVATKTLEFKDLKVNADKSLINEKMVVQIDAQLFYSVLSALPYLVSYPYECIEQTLNRFISTGIMTSLFSKFPSIEKMAKDFSSRKTQFERFDEPDPNRRMALEETPWLNEAKGGKESADNLINVLDSRVAKANRVDSLTKLEKAQTSLGGFPWFSGGPPSPYITMYVVYGFSKAMEFGVDVPKEMTRKAWDYLHRHYVDEIVKLCMAHDSCWEEITFLNYIISNYPTGDWGQNVFTAEERNVMLNFSFKHWKEHSPYLKGYLSLTLHRAKRPADAKLVWDSVMDSAKYNEDEGTHWAREDRSWLWYNDTIETHAFALRTLMELGSDNTKRDGLVQWLFLNKKLNHWQSTRATAEVVYSLSHFLSKTNQLGVREAVNIKVGAQAPIDMEFLPDKYTGKKNQIVFEGEKVKPELMPIVVKKSTPGFMFASANWQFSTEKLPEKAVGDFLEVDRKYFLRDNTKKEVVLRPLAEGAEIRVGDEVEVHLSLKSKHPVGYVHLRDPRGAGFEPVDNTSKHKWDLGIYWYEEIRDSGTNFFFEQLPQGEYNFKYRIRAATAGEFKVSPATVQPMYAPEFAAYSSGVRLKIARDK